MPEDKRCGTCTHYQITAIINRPPFGRCNYPIPFDTLPQPSWDFIHVKNGLIFEDQGTNCPCWARKDDVDG